MVFSWIYLRSRSTKIKTPLPATHQQRHNRLSIARKGLKKQRVQVTPAKRYLREKCDEGCAPGTIHMQLQQNAPSACPQGDAYAKSTKVQRSFFARRRHAYANDHRSSLMNQSSKKKKEGKRNHVGRDRDNRPLRRHFLASTSDCSGVVLRVEDGSVT